MSLTLLGLLLLMAAAGFLLLVFTSRSKALVAAAVGFALLAGLVMLPCVYWLAARSRHVVHSGAVQESLVRSPQPIPQPTTIELGAHAEHSIQAEAEPSPPPAAGEPTQPARPKWVDGTLGRQGEVYMTKAETGPFSTLRECEAALPDALRSAATAYIDRVWGEGAGALVNLDLPYIHQRIVTAEWVEHRQHSVGTMVYLHAKLEFDGAVNKDIDHRHRQALVARRLGYTGLGTGLFLGLLGTAFAYLKLDTLTRGYYTRRLQAAAGAVILAEAVIVALAARSQIGL